MINFHTKHRDLSEVTGQKRNIALSRCGRSHQRGITLIVGVIFLAMLMVLTVIGFRNTTLSERMTGNAFDRNTSFQSAENAAKEAEEALEAFKVDKVTDIDEGYYSIPLSNGGNTDFWTQDAGATTECENQTNEHFSWTSCSNSVEDRYKFETNDNNAQNAQPAQYVIEKLSIEIIKPITYRVTTRSTGGSGDAEVILQMIKIIP